MIINIKDYYVVWDIMTKRSWIPVKMGITAKIDAPTMLLLFNKRKNKALTEKDFYRTVFDNQFKQFIDDLKKDDPEREIYTQIFLEFNDDQDDWENQCDDDLDLSKDIPCTKPSTLG